MRKKIENAKPEIVRLIEYMRRADKKTGKPQHSFDQIAGILNKLGYKNNNGDKFTRNSVSMLAMRISGREKKA
jgi:hypothetical protein